MSAPIAVAVRDERAADLAAIAAVQQAAFRDHPFSRHDEARIVARLRERGALSLSLVAQASDSGEILGHIAFSPVRIAGQDCGWYGLGPVAVLPAAQRRGLGSALIEAGLARLHERGAAGCVLLGDPAYYGRFGFALQTGLQLPGVPANHFMALRLDGAKPWPTGTVSYDLAFGKDPVPDSAPIRSRSFR